MTDIERLCERLEWDANHEENIRGETVMPALLREAAAALRQSEQKLMEAENALGKMLDYVCDAGHHLKRYSYEKDGKIFCAICERDDENFKARSAEQKAAQYREWLGEALKLGERDHYYCEDSWYSCPLAEEGCANENEPKDKCNCGADEKNAKLAAIRKGIEDVGT